LTSKLGLCIFYSLYYNPWNSVDLLGYPVTFCCNTCYIFSYYISLLTVLPCPEIFAPPLHGIFSVPNGRAIAQAVSRRPSPTAALVRVQVRLCGFVVDKVALEQVFSEYFGFPCQFSFHRQFHSHHLSFGAGTIGQTVTDVRSGVSPTPSQETRKKTVFLMTHLFMELPIF
jgi:hypothetical protein